MSRNIYLIYKNTHKSIKEILQLSNEQIQWLLHNINKDREEIFRTIETAIDSLKMYINPEMYKKEQQMKKDTEHKTVLDDALKAEFKGKGLSDDQLKDLEKIFK